MAVSASWLCSATATFAEISLHNDPHGFGVDHALVGILSLSEISTRLQGIRRSQGGQRPQQVLG